MSLKKKKHLGQDCSAVRGVWGHQYIKMQIYELIFVIYIYIYVCIHPIAIRGCNYFDCLFPCGGSLWWPHMGDLPMCHAGLVFRTSRSMPSLKRRRRSRQFLTKQHLRSSTVAPPINSNCQSIGNILIDHICDIQLVTATST